MGRREGSASSDEVSWSVAIPNAVEAVDESPFSAGLNHVRSLRCLALHEGACGCFIASFTTAADEGRYCFALGHVVCLVGARGAPKVPFECCSDCVIGADRTSGLAECGTTVWSSLASRVASRGWTHQFCSFRELVGWKARLLMGSLTFCTYNYYTLKKYYNTSCLKY